ncbi:MAG: hypothetical protein MJA27_24910 [Pseudanabaenales cyanobacterium]|nr:hypothetical protein [Pseudanabaenales cyanobacterium]
MTHKNSPLNCPSADLEKAALNRFRTLVLCLPQTCKVFRELRDRSTVVCLDFTDCPDSLKTAMAQFLRLQLAAHYLGLADSLRFQINNTIVGWTKMAPSA